MAMIPSRSVYTAKLETVVVMLAVTDCCGPFEEMQEHDCEDLFARGLITQQEIGNTGEYEAVLTKDGREEVRAVLNWAKHRRDIGI